MKITDTQFSDQILKFVDNALGNIFFFNHVAVVEIHEGMHFNIKNASLIINEFTSYFGQSQPYGVVANLTVISTELLFIIY
jgi:hypothetical protein